MTALVGGRSKGIPTVFNNDPNRPNQYGQPQPVNTGLPVGPTPNTLSGGIQVAGASAIREGFLTAAFVWMFVALLVSAGSAAFVMNNAAAMTQVINNWFLLLIGNLALVFGITLLIRRINPLVALALFFIYALVNGLTLGVLVSFYAAGPAGPSGVVTAFLGASAIFAGAAVYGGVTKRDLTSLGGILFMGVIGLLVVMLAQVFLFPGNGLMNLAIGVVGVVIFTGLTAFDVQRMKDGKIAGLNKDSASVMGALALYLDFINLFLFMLRIFGSNR
ncbi:MAG: Bax inhibitor-1/YccA family protein [Chloroflexi bacterium]|nr:Bax inhibitor-1/YccA family protein [Chloroflexota bacterium]